jgi:hypothetical protein
MDDITICEQAAVKAGQWQMASRKAIRLMLENISNKTVPCYVLLGAGAGLTRTIKMSLLDA